MLCICIYIYIYIYVYVYVCIYVFIYLLFAILNLAGADNYLDVMANIKSTFKLCK